jgi:hypothetical protein
VYRPYRDVVVYAVGHCLKNVATGDTFVVGHRVDRYPAFGTLTAKVDKGLLVFGRKADDTPFMRTVDEGRRYDYTLAYRNAAASLSVWSLHLPAANGQPEMTFTTIDGRDFSARPARRRNVTVTMAVGPAQTSYWQGVLAYGSHTGE